MAAAIDIVIRTYVLPWLELSLLSIARHVEGYRTIVVVVPGSSVERLRGDEMPASARAILHQCPDYADDYAGEKVTKLSADALSDAELIVHLDSDCIFPAPCSLPAPLTKDGLLVIRCRQRSRRSPADGWCRCIVDFRGEPLAFDALAPPLFNYVRGLYHSLRGHGVARHDMALEDWYPSRRPDTLSEFGLLEAHAWFHHRDDYRWVSADDVTGWRCHAYWSRSVSAANQRAELAREFKQRPA